MKTEKEAAAARDRAECLVLRLEQLMAHVSEKDLWINARRAAQVDCAAKTLAGVLPALCWVLDDPRLAEVPEHYCSLTDYFDKVERGVEVTYEELARDNARAER